MAKSEESVPQYTLVIERSKESSAKATLTSPLLELDTHSRYLIVLKTPLDSDHQRSFDFENDKVVEFRVDG